MTRRKPPPSVPDGIDPDPIARHRGFALAEQARVEGILARDRADAAADRARRAAVVEVRQGVFYNIEETVLPPTDEWLGKAPVRRYTPRLPDGHIRTARTVSTVRRVLTPVTVQMCASARISEEQFIACRWYRSAYDQAGISGRYKASNFSLAGGGSGSGTPQHPMAQHHGEVEARQNYRAARAALDPQFVGVFEGVVLFDLSLRAASHWARRSNARLLGRFQDSCNRLIQHLRAYGIDLDQAEKKDG